MTSNSSFNEKTDANDVISAFPDSVKNKISTHLTLTLLFYPSEILPNLTHNSNLLLYPQTDIAVSVI